MSGVNNIRYMLQSFLGAIIFSAPGLNALRKNYYRRTFNMGQHCVIGSGVIFAPFHDPDTTGVRIGDRVIISNNAFFDYSGGLIIENDVAIGREVLIYTHRHLRHAARAMTLNNIKNNVEFETDFMATPLRIQAGALIGARAMILPGVNTIGKNSVISAGAVVTKSVPNNTIVAGNPAVIVYQKRQAVKSSPLNRKEETEE